MEGMYEEAVVVYFERAGFEEDRMADYSRHLKRIRICVGSEAYNTSYWNSEHALRSP